MILIVGSSLIFALVFSSLCLRKHRLKSKALFLVSMPLATTSLITAIAYSILEKGSRQSLNLMVCAIVTGFLALAFCDLLTVDADWSWPSREKGREVLPLSSTRFTKWFWLLIRILLIALALMIGSLLILINMPRPYLSNRVDSPQVWPNQQVVQDLALEGSDLHDIAVIKQLEKLEAAFLVNRGGIRPFLEQKRQFHDWLLGKLAEMDVSRHGRKKWPYYEPISVLFLEEREYVAHFDPKEVEDRKIWRELIAKIEKRPVSKEAQFAWQKLSRQLHVCWGGNSGLPPPRQVREALRLYRLLAYGI